ncbi:MAG: glycosyl transferase [Candidatus Hydrogenedentota bacterium]
MEQSLEISALGVTARPLDLEGLHGLSSVRHLKVPARAMYACWNATGYPKADRLLQGVDVYHATNFFLPPVHRARRVLSIYDLAFLVMPETGSPRVVGPFSRHIRKFAREADAILACSEATKQDIVERLDVSPGKIRVAYGAVDESLRPMPTPAAKLRLQQTYGISDPFILFTGTLEPRKNLPMLLKAFARIQRRIPHRLVLAGGLGWNMDGLASECAALGIADRVQLPGYVPGSDLAALYSAADVFVLPSRYEGFGLPLLEAMACGCPVVSCRNSSIPEVVGDAGLLCETGDDEAMAEAILSVVEDPHARSQWTNLGAERARHFTWRRCAEIALQTYKDVSV